MLATVAPFALGSDKEPFAPPKHATAASEPNGEGAARFDSLVDATGALGNATIRKVHSLGSIFLSSKLDPSDLESVKEAGIKTVIDLCHASETKFDEESLVDSLGMSYYAVRWNGPDELTPQVFNRTRELLKTAERPILLHCASANRVGAVWIPFRVADAKVPLDQAVREAKTIGLRTPAYETIAREYVEDAAPDMSGTYDAPIDLAVRRNVHVVYQIKTDAWKGDVAAGLHYLAKLARVYDELGIAQADRDIVGVFHGDAGYFLVKDPAYQKAAERSGENPNKQIVRELLDAGVKLELCKSTMESHGWTGEDVLPGVRIVVGAYPRVIDLQLRGYAYIRF